MRIGLYPNISHDEYHSIEAVSNSYLSRLAEVPALAKVEQEETAAMSFGSAFHSYLLDGVESFNKQYYVESMSNVDRRTKEGKAAHELNVQLAQGRILISEQEFDKITRMSSAVIAHPFAIKVLSQGRSEMSVFWTDKETGLYCKCRPDRIPDGDHGVIVDVKTTNDASPKAFLSSVVRMGYHRQAAIYIEGYNAATNGKVDAFIFIAVEKEPPYRVECYTLEDMFINYGKDEFHRLLRLEKECRENDFYPHWTGDVRTGEELIELSLPNWAVI